MTNPYLLDAYGIELERALTPKRADMIGYWHGMWSHRRQDGLWKGFLRVELNPDDDRQARQELDPTVLMETDNEV